MEKRIFSTEIGGKTLTLETGRLARQATASVLATYGETTVLATIVVAKEAKEGMGFLPLKVNFDEKFYAAGKIKGSRFMKREARPADAAILTSRAIDRTIRPLFPKGFYNDMQIILTVLSFDDQNSPDMVAAIGCMAALAMSNAPSAANVALGRVGSVDGNLVYNPTLEEQSNSSLNILVGSLSEKVIMIEAGINEVPENEVFKAIEFGMEQNKIILKVIDEMQQELGLEKLVFTPKEYDKDLYSKITDFVGSNVDVIYGKIDKMTRQNYVSELKERTVAEFTKEISEEELGEKTEEIKGLYEKAVKQVIRTNILEKERRVGGRTLDEIRPLYIETEVIPRVHGSALFQRGETQGLCITTLSGPGEGQLIDNMNGETVRRYMHHYNFPPFSVGDINGRRFVGNREIGHGFLAEKALLPVLPSEEDFPYTMRVVTEILESNGSSSMAAACGSTLSLMDAGVPIKRPVSGVAMGLMVDPETGNYKVLTDLQDIEDFGGDMDFKVTGTEKGITAIQVDMKIHGLTFDIVKDALEKSKIGRATILEAMLKVISSPRADLKPTAPRIVILKIDPDMIALVIGKGGETIQKIIRETGVTIDINDDGQINITSVNAENSKKAVDWIKSITREIKVGEEFEAKVKKVVDFGAFVELVPGKEALCHISELAHRRVNDVKEIVKIGDILKVKVKGIENGKISVSHKALLPRD